MALRWLGNEHSNGTTEPYVAEIIGRTAVMFPSSRYTARQTVDRTQVDYRFWSHLRRGKEPGYELGALFAKPIAEVIAHWTLGRGFDVQTGNTALDKRVKNFVRENLHTMLQFIEAGYGDGDSYLAVNPDGSLTALNPDAVEKITDDLHYTRVVGYRVTTRLEKVTITDEYVLDAAYLSPLKGQSPPAVRGQLVSDERPSATGQALRRIAAQYADGREEVLFFDIPTGLLPIVHFGNDMGANEVYGHPIYEALLRLFIRYDDVLNKSLDGVELMGRPIPVAEGLDNVDAAKKANRTSTKSERLASGEEVTVDIIDWSDLEMLFFGGANAKFKFASPDPFSADSVAMLKKLFMLMLEHIGIPEWAWGGAVSSSKASVEAQLPAFIRFLEGKRTELEKVFRQLATVWLATVRLFEFLPPQDRLQFIWPQLETRDEVLQLNKLNSAHDRGVLTDATYLRLLELVDDPQEEAQAARDERDARDDRFAQRLDAEADSIRTLGQGDPEPEAEAA